MKKVCAKLSDTCSVRVRANGLTLATLSFLKAVWREIQTCWNSIAPPPTCNLRNGGWKDQFLKHECYFGTATLCAVILKGEGVMFDKREVSQLLCQMKVNLPT